MTKKKKYKLYFQPPKPPGGGLIKTMMNDKYNQEYYHEK
jgi:hypothetical protein